jgi:1-deoxy-D-xylulose-5-phosphate synthase
MAENDPRVVAITAAMPDRTGLNAFANRFPGRFFDVGIAEQHAVTMAAGLARSGYRPVVAIYSSFLQRAYDQIVHDVCIPQLPVVFAVDRAGLVGADGETHQGIFDIAMLRHIPNMTVMMPKDFAEMEQMLDFAALHDGPITVRYPRGGSKPLPVTLSGTPLTLGRGEVLRDGRDIALIGLGPTLGLALQAQAELHNRGLSAAVINPRFVKPLDEELIGQYAARCGRLVVIEEHVTNGGLGSAIMETCSKLNLFPQIKVVGIEDMFVTHGERDELLNLCGLTVENIVAAGVKISASGEAKWQRKKGLT